MTDFIFNNSVTEAEFKEAMTSLQTAINKKDTPKEWLEWTANTIFLTGKLAVSVFGYGPALELIKHVFGNNQDVMKILELLLKEKKDA